MDRRILLMPSVPLLLPLTLFGLLLALGGCTRSFEADPWLQVQLSSEPVSLDPALAEDGVSMRVLHNTMDGLVGYDGAGVLRNRLAAEYSRSSDGLKYRFKLRADAKWSDGKSVRAEDFVYGFARTLLPATASKLGEVLLPIRGAHGLMTRGRTATGAKISGRGNGISNTGEPSFVTCAGPGDAPPGCFGVYADGLDLVIELERPVGYFVQVLATLSAMPAREDSLTASGGKWTNETPVTGPYRIAAHKLDQEIRLEPNPYYYAYARVGARRPPSVLLRIVTDESTGLSLFDRGKIDVLMRVPTLDIARMRKTGLLHTDPFFATYFLGFNTRKPPFNRVEWRRAVSAAIRRDEVVNALGGGEMPATSWIPPGLEGHSPYVDFAHVPGATGDRFREAMAAVKKEIARSWLRDGLKKKSIREQVQPGGVNGILPAEQNDEPASVIRSITAQFDASSRNALIMEKIQSDLYQALGLPLALVRFDWKTHVRSLTTDPAPIYRFGWSTIYSDPSFNLQAYTSGNANNYTGWKSVAYDRLVGEIEKMDPSPARVAKIHEADRILVEEAAVIAPIFHYVQVHAVSKRVHGFRVSPFGVIRFDELSLAKP